MAGYVEGPTNLYTSTAEITTLAFILAAFVLITILAIRSRSTTGFKFEMFVFTLVLTASETPRILDTLGLVDISSIGETGLFVHTVSMVILAVFIAVRVYKFHERR